MTKLKKWLKERQAAGAKTVSLATALELVEEAEAEPVKLPRLFGTAEAAEYLGIERTRIGKWMNAKYGRPVMVEPATRLSSGPVWTLDQLRKMKPIVKERRRGKKNDDE